MVENFGHVRGHARAAGVLGRLRAVCVRGRDVTTRRARSRTHGIEVDLSLQHGDAVPHASERDGAREPGDAATDDDEVDRQ